MARILFKFIIYASCKRVLKNMRVKSKIGNRLLVTWFFLLHTIMYDYFSTVFCIVQKKVLFLEYLKWVSHLKNRYHYAKVVENPRINFSISPYCTLLFCRKENFKVLEVALSAVLCKARLTALWMREDISIELLSIPHWTFACFSKTAIKALRQCVKFAQT